jgi:hypothetical protein
MVDGIHFGLPVGEDGGSATKKMTGTQSPRETGIRIKNENLGRQGGHLRVARYFTQSD